MAVILEPTGPVSVQEVEKKGIKVVDIASHRNGVSGAPFHVVLFDEDGSRKVAVLYDDMPGFCAVLGVEKLAEGDIRFGKNSFRGDLYEAELREAIRLRFLVN